MQCKLCGADISEIKEYGFYCSMECKELDISICRYIKNKRKKDKRKVKQEAICGK